MLAIVFLLGFPQIGPTPKETIAPPIAAPLVIWDINGPVALADLQWFGITRKNAYDGWQFAEGHLKWIDSRWWDNAGWEGVYWVWSKQALTYAWAWYHLSRALHENESEESRLYQLQMLRERIGVEAYYSGRMPPPAPYWFFTEK